MVLVWVRNEQWWFFISKTVLSSSKIPKLIFLITWGSKSSKFLLLYDVNWPEKFNHDNELVAKNLTGVVLADFRKKRPILATPLILNYCSHAPLNFQGASFNYTYNYIFDHCFLTKKLQNRSILKNFLTNVLVTRFRIRVHILSFYYDEYS